MQDALLTDSIRRFLAAPYVAVLATVSPSGRPQVTPVWYLLEDDGHTLLINTAQGRTKLRNLQQNPHVTLLVMDPANPYRYVQIAGRLGRADRESGAADIDRLALRYTGQPYVYRNGDRPDRRISLHIRILRVQSLGV